MNGNARLSSLAAARQTALRLQHELRAAPEAGSEVPDVKTLEQLEAEWLPENLVRCRVTPICEGPCQQHRRCEASYWRSHHKKVSTLMGQFAEVLGFDPIPYHAAGSVYDLDYLKFPHDVGDGPLTEAHPYPIVRALVRLNAPPSMCLAVLEHAPHLALKYSGPLSLALSACGEIVTLAAADLYLQWPADLPAKWIACLSSVSRGGLNDPDVMVNRFYSRVHPALRSLLAGHFRNPVNGCQ